MFGLRVLILAWTMSKVLGDPPSPPHCSDEAGEVCVPTASEGGDLLNLLQLGRSKVAGSEADLRGKPPATYRNPILRGSYPDPSIVRVGKDYYMVSSSFEYYPGLPIHHSTDLVNWELVGYALHRREQVSGKFGFNMEDVKQDDGAQAATIRYHDGTFYIVNTFAYHRPDPKKKQLFSFIVTAKDVRGPWSDPHVLDSAIGIDPSLYWDDDGRVWYAANHGPKDPAFRGQGEIWLQELDVSSYKLIGERYFLWRGACDGMWAEGPHIFKVDSNYYLIIAEGGTGYTHAVTVASSPNITGPYVTDPRNPVLTSRTLSYDYWAIKVGHSDLVELPDGRWYAVALGVRGELERSSNMGRESFLVPMIWQMQPEEYTPHIKWPVMAPQTGHVERFEPLPFPDSPQCLKNTFEDDFDSETLHLQWNFRRVPVKGTYSLSANPGALRLYAHEAEISDQTQYSLVGVRQWEMDFRFSAGMHFEPEEDGIEAGLVFINKDDHYLKCTIVRKASKWVLSLVSVQPKEQANTLAETTIVGYSGKIEFEVVSTIEQGYIFSYSLGCLKTGKKVFAKAAPNLLLYSGYTGAYLSFYATSAGKKNTNAFADFDWVNYSVTP